MGKMAETTVRGPAHDFWLLHGLHIPLLLSWNLFSHCSII